ncbi:MAG: serine protease [Candidatus Aminicenantes bacterium RBG_13_59_9]|jgi:membrane-bound serine protease (ClpP class)|nr:MAG: serine protease [Candidatus Aminicenantes bacterium RBG_13_59_9]
MKRIFRLSVVVLLLLLPARAAIIRITVEAPIHPVTSEYIMRSIDKAAEDRASLLIIVLNTPGGLDTAMREIIAKILSSPVPVMTYVGPAGARAASAGFYIGIASDLFVMAPGTNTGAAHPVGISITGQAMDKTMEEKVTHDAASYMKSLAEKRGRNVQAAEDAVRKSLSYTEKEALENGLIDFVAGTTEEIVAHFDGRTLRRFDGETAGLKLKGEEVIDLPMSARQKFLLTISNPNLAYILLMLGLLGLYFEFAHPGAILPGVLGGISLLLAIFSFQILPINYVALLLILLAIGLFILEVKVQSYGILGVGGVIAMVIGSVMLVDSPVPELQPSLKIIIPLAVGLSLIFLFLLFLVVRAHSRKAYTGKEGLVGEIGTAQTDLSPEGKVFVHGELWNAEAAAEPIARGSKVKVTRVLDSLKIRVDRL